MSNTEVFQLRQQLGSAELPVDKAMSDLERMPTDDSYMAVGQSALVAIRMAQLNAGHADFESILDMPCGHGRVTRWLKAGYPSASLTACDLLRDGVDFCRDTFGAVGVYSTPAPNIEIFPDRYDLIWVGSLLTHIHPDRWWDFVTLWHDLLLPDGLLVVTTSGNYVSQRMRDGDFYGLALSSVNELRASYAIDNRAFSPYPDVADFGSDYGVSLARPDWALLPLLAHPDFRVVLCREALWDNHQDVLAAQKMANP